MPTTQQYKDFRNPVAIFGNGLGDHLTTLPALRALAALFPSRLSLICIPGVRRDFFRGIPLRSVCEIKMFVRRNRGEFNAAEAAGKVGKCDLFLSLNPWHSPSVDRLLELLSPAFSIGFYPAFQVCVPKVPSEHVVDRAFRVPAFLDPSLRLGDFASPPQVPARVRQHVRQYLRQAVPGRRVLAAHNEASDTKRRWLRDRFFRVLDLFLRRHPEFVVFLLGHRSSLVRAVRGRDRPLYSGGLPFPYAFSVVAESELFLGVDSCMLHAADLFRIPGVGLFGPSDPRKAGFRFGRHRHVTEPLGMPCLQEEPVLEALESLLN